MQTKIILQDIPKSIKSGFTIIELLVSISIIMIMLGITFAGYTQFNQRQEVATAGQSLKNIIRDAQNRAITGEMDCNVCDCSTASPFELLGWYVDFTNQRIYGECRGGIIFGEKNFEFDSQITVMPTPVGILFRQTPPGIGTDARICITRPGMTDYYSVYINSAGVVSDSGGLGPECVTPTP